MSGGAVGVAMLCLVLANGVAGATTRLRSGAVHTQLASHVSASANPAPTGLVPEGAHVMAGVVATLALLALAFLVVTLIRRRVSTTA